MVLANFFQGLRLFGGLRLLETLEYLSCQTIESLFNLEFSGDQISCSRVSNKRRPPNKRRPWKKLAKTINVDP